jgi:hypothetical protein
MIDVENLSHQKTYEKGELVLRQHWIVPVQIFIVFAILVAIPIVSYQLFSGAAPVLFASNTVQAILALGLSAYAFTCLLFLFQTYLDFYLDVWIITNERILSSERVSVFHQTMSELRLFRAQDVTSNVEGFMQTLLDYGTIEIQTAGEEEHFVMKNVPHPKDVANEIIALADADRDFHKEKLAKIASGVSVAEKDEAILEE